jgi:hypothetical protein
MWYHSMYLIYLNRKSDISHEDTETLEDQRKGVRTDLRADKTAAGRKPYNCRSHGRS